VSRCEGKCGHVTAHGLQLGATAAHERQRVEGPVDADGVAVATEPRAVPARTAACIEQHEIGAPAETWSEEIGDERARVAIPPVVVLDRGDAGVLLDLHRAQGIGLPPFWRRKRVDITRC
jgi:hypothetical protein